MFNALRKGPAAIGRVSRVGIASFAPPTLRTSAYSLPLQTTGRLIVSSRLLHASSGLLAQWEQRGRGGFSGGDRGGFGGGDRGGDRGGYRGRAQGGYRERRRAEPEDYPPTAEAPAEGELISRFEELAEKGLVHQNVIRQITEGMGHQTMTDVQQLTIHETLKGTDVIAQARTGTGKTLGFLLPVIQNILKVSPELAESPDRRYKERAKPSDIRAIIISPTRELAEQIAVEAKKVTRQTQIVVQTAVGGVNKGAMLREVQRDGCHILVATPGRLNDLLTDEWSRIKAPGLKALVLDEADRLLDDGFSKDIEDIIELLPRRSEVDRQTLLFSATVPKEVIGLVRRTLKDDFKFVQTVQEGDVATHEKVPQKLVEVRSLENSMPALLELAKREVDAALKASTGPDSETAKPFKAIVYFSSTANVELAGAIFQNLRGSSGGLFGQHPLAPARISEMHGKLTQQQRTRVSDNFRKAKSGIMFSSDVTARGMDFPNVTHVIQVGLPTNRDQYIHRIGRTGRGDKTGEGWIILTAPEVAAARRQLRGLPINRDTSLQAAVIDMTKDAQLPAELATILSQVGDATKMVDRGTKAAAYMALLGASQLSSDKQTSIDLLNQWTRYGWGWEVPPTVNPMLAQRLGLGNCHGLNFKRSDDPGEDGGRRGDSGDRRGGDRGRGGYGGGRDRDGGRGGFGGGRDRDGGRGGFGGSHDKYPRGFGRDRASEGHAKPRPNASF